MSIDFQRLEQVLADAVARSDPTERAAFLAQACGDDRELRAEVERLLAAHEQAGDFLEAPVQPEPMFGDQPGETQAMPDSGVAIERPGSMIGRYKLLEQIGEGGFGVVYMAEQVEPVQRKVALKIIKAGMDTREVVARFEAERQALALMDHPNIARVFDGGVTQAGRPYFVMELVRGIPMTDFCDQRNVAMPERLKLFTQVCHAVQHAHQKGIIHRDLKPSNILVTLIDGEPLPKVIDFGVAKALGQKLTEKTLFTAFAQMVGTPAYMSPEQAELSALDVDTRSDIYSLGVLLYELLTGVTPFDAETFRRAALDEIRRMIRETEPSKPSTRLHTMGDKLTDVARHRHIEPAALRKLVRGDLDWIVMKCLEKDRGRRYETANSLVGDIERHLNHEPVLACPPGTGYRLRKFVRRNRVPVAFATSVAAVLVIGLILSLVGFGKARQERDRAEQEAGKAQAVNQFLQEMLASVDPELAKGQEVSVRQLLDAAAGKIERGVFSSEPEIEYSVRTSLGKTYLALGRYQNAEPHLRAALRLAGNLYGQEDARVASSLYELGRLLNARGHYSESEPMVRQALAMRRRLLGGVHREVADCQLLLGILVGNQRQYASAEILLREVLVMQRRLLGNEHADVATTLYVLAGSILNQGDPARAEPLYREALAMQRKLLGNEHVRVARTLSALATSILNQGDSDRAEPLYREALAMKRKFLGNEHPELVNTLQALGSLLEAKGDTQVAEALYREAAATALKLLDPEHPLTPRSLGSLTRLLESKGDYAAVEHLLVETYDAFENRLGDEHKLTRDTAARLSQVCCRLGRTGEAVCYARLSRSPVELSRISPEGVAEAIELVHSSEPPDPPFDRIQYGEHLLLSGDVERAVQAMRQAIESGGTEHGYYRSLGWALLRAGREPEAKAAYEKVLAIVDWPTDSAVKADPDHWAAAYFLDRVNEQQYAERWRSDAESRGKLACVPWFYIGQRKEIEGKRNEAIAAYRTSVELGKLTDASYIHNWSAYRLHVLTGEPLDTMMRRATSRPATRAATLRTD